MRLWHPLNAIPSGWARGLTFCCLLLLTGVIGMKAMGPFKTEQTPRGIVDFEFAGNEQNARRVVQLWTAQGKREALRQHLWWDNLWLLCYSTTLAFACVMVGNLLRGYGSGWYALGLSLGWMQWIAGLLDLTENYALKQMLGEFQGDRWPLTAWWCAAFKFALVGVGLLYVFGGFIVCLATATGPPASATRSML